ncbi:MAG: hypothetical protein WBJ62_01480 [Coriobacteriia bacterium]
MGGVTLFDPNGNYDLICLEFGEKRADDIEVRISNRKGVLTEVDMQSWKPRVKFWQRPQQQLLDTLLVYATSPKDYFEIMTTCGSLQNQPEFVNGEPSREQMLPLFKGSYSFFQSTREKRDVSDFRSIPLGPAGNGLTLAHLCSEFNFGSLALLSVPAYLALAANSGFYLAPGQSVQIGRWLYLLQSPGGKTVKDFDDYAGAFLGGAYLGNNADLFLRTYALAHAIAAFAEDIKNDDFFPQATSFRDYFTDGAPLYVFERLIEVGALHNPFSRVPVWKSCPTGIENAQEVNPDLAATLALTDLLPPIMTTPVQPGAILQAFYGLIDVVSLQEYFGIHGRSRFEYPHTDARRSSQASGDDIPF